jgi:sugar phosphate permease
MKFLQFLKWLWIAAIVGFFTYVITAGIADWYMSALKSTGELVMARDALYAKVAPWLFAVLAFAGTLTFMGKK